MRAGKTILLSLLLLITTNLMAQSPLGINYQGVARSADGTPMINQVIGLRVSITSGANGSTDYIEEHHPETNEFGLFNVVVGQGQSSGSISDVDWGAGNKWLQIEVDPQDNANYMFVGSQQMMSVPYALYAAKSGESLTPGFGIDINNGQVNNLLPDKPVTLTGTGSATVSGTYPNFTISTTDNVDDADADPTNEIELPATATANQVLKWNGTNWVAGTDDINDGDVDATNELLQTAVLTGTTLELTDAAGTKTVDLSSLQDGTGTDAQTLASSVLTQDTRDLAITGGNNITLNVADNDNDSANELQTISLNTNTLGLSQGGGSVDLSGYLDNTDTQNLTSVLGQGADAGANKVTNLADPTLAQDAATKNYVDTRDALDLDKNSSNEIQDLQLAGNTLTITNNGTATPINLGTYLDNTDTQNLTSVLGQGTDAGANKITNLTDPTLAQDAATKNYVDTRDALDLDKNATNEIQNLSSVLTQGADAGNLNITNLADPVNPQDAVNLQYLEAKDATDYAINVPITFTSLSAANVPLDLSGFTLDKGGLVSGSTITISEPGVYAISVQGVSGLAAGSDIDITINGTPTTILKGLNHYLGLYLFDLVTNDTIQIIVRFGSSAETVDLQIAVYKI